MADQTASKRDWTLIGLGALTAAIGFYYFLVGFGLVPMPPAKGEANASHWVGALFGLVFSAGGIAVIVRGATGADNSSGELPANTSKWVAVIYTLLGLLVAFGLAATATWVAFGSGSRHFTMLGFISGAVGEGVGRTAFGIGAILSWLAVVLMVRASITKFFGGNADPSR